jgi:hypothetical protein
MHHRHDSVVGVFTGGIFELFNSMWWGLALGVVFVGILGRVPRDLVMGLLGRDGGVNGLFRATFAGVFLDLCSHGILAVGMKLYERGASVGQVMAFLLASPWNSFSLTLILFGLIGVGWTLMFILLSLVIGVITGWIFDGLVRRGQLPANPWQDELGERQPLGLLWGEFRQSIRFSLSGSANLLLRHLVRCDHGWSVVDPAGHHGDRGVLRGFYPDCRGPDESRRCAGQQLHLPDGRCGHRLYRGHVYPRYHPVLEDRPVPAAGNGTAGDVDWRVAQPVLRIPSQPRLG